MDTTKVSLPPIRQMLYNLTADQVGQKESTHVPPSLACSHSPDYEDKQLNYRHASLPMKHNNNEAVYTFDSWHECLPTPPYSSPESDAIASCQCAPKGLVHASCFPPPAISPSSAKKYAHHHRQQQHDRHDYTPSHYHYPPSSHRHRRAHSASTSTSPFIRTPTPTVIPLSPPSYQHDQPFVPYHQHLQHQSHYSHQVKQSVEWRSSMNGGGALYRGRTRAHTTSGYLPSSAMVPPSSPVSSSSSSSSSTTSLSPTNSSAPFMQKPSSPPYNIPITSHHHHLVESTHVSRVPLASTLRQQQQQQQQRHRYHCPHCRKTFSRPSSLRIHIYSHTGEKPHVCPYFNCGRRFSVQSNMRRHIRVHVGNNDTTPFYPRYYPEGSLQPPHLMTIPSL